MQEVDGAEALAVAAHTRCGGGAARGGRPRRPRWGATAGETAEARKGGTLRLSRHTDVDSVDAALATFTHSWMLEYATCAKLFNYPDKPGAAGTRVIPEVVQGFTVSNDGRTYSFALRRTFRFHTVPRA